METYENMRLWDIHGAVVQEGRTWRQNVHASILSPDIELALAHFKDKYPGVEIFQVINRSASKTVEVAR